MFATLATSFLLNCDKNNRPNTITLLRGQVRDLKGQTPMQIALEADFKEFVAQPAFQEILNQFWSKRIIEHSKHKYLPVSCWKQLCVIVFRNHDAKVNFGIIYMLRVFLVA